MPLAVAGACNTRVDRVFGDGCVAAGCLRAVLLMDSVERGVQQ